VGHAVVMPILAQFSESAVIMTPGSAVLATPPRQVFNPCASLVVRQQQWPPFSWPVASGSGCPQKQPPGIPSPSGLLLVGNPRRMISRRGLLVSRGMQDTTPVRKVRCRATSEGVFFISPAPCAGWAIFDPFHRISWVPHLGSAVGGEERLERLTKFSTR
jgi:hypothetical protein